MTKRMLIDASHPEETRVVVVDGTRVEELDFESRNKRQLRGNVYLARVTRVEPSLQAAFIEYGGNRHGFLAFSEIHPDYYQIPYEDRMALIEAEEAAAAEAEKEEEEKVEAKAKAKPRRKSRKDKEKSETSEAEETAEDETEEKPKSRGRRRAAPKRKTSKDSDETATTSDEEDSSDEDEDEKPKKKGHRRAAPARARSKSKSKAVESDEDDEDDEDDAHSDDEIDVNVDPTDEDVSDANDAEVAEEQTKTASTRRKRMSRRRYKIQEVIKRGQILLVQAVKEERGNKGAAMTTYLSLAGRYCVLMPNTPRGGGISRKISNGSDRKRLKTIMSDLDVQQGMGVIVRTAGAKRTKAEITRDYDYLSRLWSDIRDTTLKSTAPALIHEEGDLVKRSIRDLYNKDIEEVLVEGEDAYKTANTFIKMLMPSHAKYVKQYKEDIPLFLRFGVERQIEASLDHVVQLKSGGYLVIHPTEALVSVDVNSGRSTKERNVERTALRTNLEAAEEVARQMRLRDLAGLIVIDFIDMDENRNNRAVEKKMKDALTQDRARIQTSRISQFGLMEISRQRRRRSLLEGSTATCEHCLGVGRKRTIESSALAAIRAVEEVGARRASKRIRLKTSPDVALYLLNEKRNLLSHVEQNADVFTEILGDDSLIRPAYEIETIEKRKGKNIDPLDNIEKELRKETHKSRKKTKSEDPKDTSDESEDDKDDENKTSRRRSRRGRRGGRGRRRDSENQTDQDQNNSEETDSKSVDSNSEDTETKKPVSRGRSRRKAPAKDQVESKQSVDAKPDEEKPAPEAKPKPTRAGRRKAPSRIKDDDKPDTKPAPRKRAAKKASAKAETKADVSKVESSSSTRRKAPVKKAAPKKAATKKPAAKKATKAATKDKTEVKATTSSRRRAAPKKPAEPKAEAKAKPTRKAPAKKAPAKKPAAKKAPVKKAAPKKPATKKAPVNKTAPKAEAAKPKPIEEASKPEVSKARRKAPARKKKLTDFGEPEAKKPKKKRFWDRLKPS